MRRDVLEEFAVKEKVITDDNRPYMWMWRWHSQYLIVTEPFMREK